MSASVNAVWIALTVLGGLAYSQSSKSKPVSLPAGEAAKLRVLPEITSVTSTLREQGETLDWTHAMLESVDGLRHTSIPIKGRSTKPEFEALVIEQSGGKVNVYFESPTGSKPRSNPQATLFGGCGGWSSWQNDGTEYCSGAVCLFKNNQATFQNEYRTRNCRAGQERQVRHIKQHCGC